MQVPSFILNLLGNPSHESNEWTYFIYSQTILFLACVTRQRILALYNHDKDDEDDEHIHDQIEPDDISESSRTASVGLQRKKTYVDYKAREKRERDSHVGEATSAIWSFMNTLYGFSVRLVALHGRPLLCVYIFGHCISYASVVTHVIGTYAVFDLIMVSKFGDVKYEEMEEEQEKECGCNDSDCKKCKRSIKSDICNEHGGNREKMSCPQCKDQRPGEWAKFLTAQSVKEKRIHQPSKKELYWSKEKQEGEKINGASHQSRAAGCNFVVCLQVTTGI